MLVSRALLLTVLVGGLAGLTLATACITLAPRDLPQSVAQGPTILRYAVVPPTDEILTALPLQGFVVPVQLDEPSASFAWEVFVDYDPDAGTGTTPVLVADQNDSPVDGGISLVDFTLGPLDPSQCHVIEFLVAQAFDTTSSHTSDGPGGDIVTWFYNAAGGPGSCPVYDAGPAQAQGGAGPVEAEAATAGLDP